MLAMEVALGDSQVEPPTCEVLDRVEVSVRHANSIARRASPIAGQGSFQPPATKATTT